MNTPAQSTEWYASRFALFEKTLNGASRSALHAQRRKSLAAFRAAGFPTTGDEEWRFTNVSAIAKTEFLPVTSHESAGVTADDIARFSVAGKDALQLVFINGLFSPSLSRLDRLPPGVTAGSLAEAIARDPSLVDLVFGSSGETEQNGFTALNGAFLIDGAYVHLTDGAHVDRPVHLLCLSAKGTSPFISNPRHLIIAGRNAHLSIVETYAGLGPSSYLTNAVTDVVVREGASLEHDAIQIESPGAFHVRSTRVRVEGRSSFTSNAITLGGALTRNNVRALFTGERAECTLNGLALGTGAQLIDNHTVIDHAVPDCASHELYKSILDGEARGVFNGKIFVRPDAQKTDAKQTNKTLLLSDEATIDTKPQLEIFADDVKCTHGATVGQLDEDQLFYLRARGIGLSEAKDLLTVAFATDVINRVHVEPLRVQLETLLRSRLRQGRVAAEE
ncbi:MAG TPA: Fe-S cluster assembly protein SufD [Bacteroidota bacterium]|nr:Fe-S cluster assembly protein SufD [Bacteroidota bacterium]